MALAVLFVDKIDSSPTTRLDLMTTTHEVLAEGIDLSPPRLKRAVVSTLLRDGAHISASAYENRVLRFTVKVTGTTEDNLATQLNSLNRELDRANNILKWQHNGATDPLFFRTFRSPSYQRERLMPLANFTVLVHLDILAEPFALGLVQTLVNGATVTNDPDAGTNPQYVDTGTGLKGDVPTPAYITVTNNGSNLVPMLIAVRRHGTPPHLAYQCEAQTNGTDAADNVDATASDGNSVRVTPGTASWATRVTIADFPKATPDSDSRGLYRVLLRTKKTIAGDVWNVRYLANSVVTGDEVALNVSTTNWQVVDLGLLQFPLGHDPIYDGYTNTPWTPDDGELAIQAERESGSGNLDLDYILCVPADEEMCFVQQPNTVTTWLLDGPMDAVRPANSVTGVPQMLQRTGSIPMLSPNQENRIHVVRRVAVGVTDTISDTNTISVYAWPAWLDVSRPT